MCLEISTTAMRVMYAVVAYLAVNAYIAVNF